MASKIGVYFDIQNIGGGLDIETLVTQAQEKWGDTTPVVKTVPVLADALDVITADITEKGLDGVLLCGASPRADADLYRLSVQVGHVNLREQCVLSYKNADGTVPDIRYGGAPQSVAPALLAIQARDYVNMGVVKLQKSEKPDSAAIAGVKRILIIGGGWTGLTAALEAVASGYEVALVEKTDKLGGAATVIPVGSPLASPWADKQPTNVADKIREVMGASSVKVHLNARVEKLEGQPGEFTAHIASAAGIVTVTVGAVVLASGWTELDDKYLAPMGLGKCSKVMTASRFGKLLLDGQITARRIAFVLDTTLAEDTWRDASPCASPDATPSAPENVNAQDEEKPFIKENLENIRHLAYSNAVNSVGMLRLANSVCEQTDDATQAFILYKNMTVPGIFERFYKKMQNRLGIMMTKADVTDIREVGNDVVVECKNTLLGMDFNLNVDLVVLPTGLVPTTAKDAVVEFAYRQGPDFPDMELFDGFADSNYICFPYETRRTGVYAAGCVRQPQTLDACEEDAMGAVLKAAQCIDSATRGVAVHPRSGDAAYPVFNFVRCTQCKRCTEECPFGALDDDEKGTPKPNPGRCRRCGTCFGACPERVISFADYNIDQIGSMIREVVVPKDFKNEGPRVLMLACENDAYPALDMAGMRRKAWSPYVRIIPVRCLGSVNAIWVSDAMSKGFDGVMLLGCKYGNDYQCHFVKGSEICSKRKENIAETLNRLGVQPERIEQFETAIDGYDTVSDLIDGFVDRIIEMGPNPFKGM